MKHIIAILFLIVFIQSVIHGEADIPERPRVGLVLSGGGAKGLAHIGVLKVLEEIGIPIDYITGTSMGSIVGGLYAIGYRTEDLEHIIDGINWDEVLLDVISRDNISIEEKDDEILYALSLPINRGKIGLPTGLIAGQKISLILSELALSVHHIEDFNQLPIPFRCIATDIERGEVVVLKSGYLPDAIRASMSIPSVFNPIILDGQMLVDGGLLRNFPVSDVIDMGADIVIGIDVGAPLYHKKDLKSLVQIMNQSIALAGIQNMQKERALCDVLIEPDVDKYNLMSFNKADSLIARGEQAARKMLPVLKTLADNLTQFPSGEKILPRTCVDSLFLKKIHVQGLRKVSKKLVLGKLRIKSQTWILPADLTKSMESIYGSGYFERVNYKLEPAGNGVVLFIRVIESNNDVLKFGFHYDSDLKSSVLLNATFRNVMLQGSKLAIDTRMSENEAMKISYFVHTGWQPGFGVGLKYFHESFQVLGYDQEGKLEANYDYASNVGHLELQTIFSNFFSVGVAIQIEQSRLKPIIVPQSYIFGEQEFNYLQLLGFINIDTRNVEYFPTAGMRFYTEGRFIREIDNDIKDLEPLKTIRVKYLDLISLGKRTTLQLGFTGGKIIGDVIPPDFYFYLGGQIQSQKGILPLTGYKFMAITATDAAIFKLGIQYEPWNRVFITFNTNYAKAGLNFQDLYEKEYYWGIGLAVGIDTPVGPIEYSIMKGKEEEDPINFLSIGYKF